MSWGGVPLNARTAAMMDEVQALCGFTITAVKGSPDATPGSSAGTHDGEGVIDVVGPDLDLIVFNGRKVGFAGWHRTVAEGFVPHDHLVAVGEPDLSPQAADQVTDYFEGRNGLVTNAPDDGPRDFVGQTWEGYLGGDPAPGGAQVFRGEQVSIADVVVTAGSLDPYSDIFTGIETRTDSTAVTLTAGDEFYIYLNAADTVSTDVYSLINWRLNASGHGAVALADSFDTGWSYTPPFTWASLGTITLDRDDLLLTATPASAALADSTKLDGSTGSPLLRVTCTTGTVTLDWACLQVEPPAGLLVTSGSHWSQWFTPNLVEHGVAGVGSGVVEGVGNITGSITDQDTAQAAVEDAEADAVADMADELWDPIVFDDPDPNPLRAAYLQAWAKLTAYAQFGFAHVELQSAFQGAEWGTWPDYRQMPPELDALAAKGEVATDHGFPLYEFDDGDTSSVRWHGKVIEGDFESDSQLRARYFEDEPASPSDASVGSVGLASNAGGTSYPVVSALATYGQLSPVPEEIEFTTAPPGADLVLAAVNDYFDGHGINPPISGWAGGGIGGITPTTVITREWRIDGYVTILLQMPNYRYQVNDWTRSPDALDTTDPEGVVTYLRNRQRNDGLGGWSTPRAKGTSSRQLSLHNRGYE